MSLLVACLALVLAGITAYRVRVIERNQASHNEMAAAAAKIAVAARRVDDRLTYYENRNIGLQQLRADYHKQIAKKRAAIDADAPDAAPEGTAQAEHLIG